MGMKQSLKELINGLEEPKDIHRRSQKGKQLVNVAEEGL